MNTRDTIVDVRAYNKANRAYETYRAGWEAQEDAKIAAAPTLAVSAEGK